MSQRISESLREGLQESISDGNSNPAEPGWNESAEPLLPPSLLASTISAQPTEPRANSRSRRPATKAATQTLFDDHPMNDAQFGDPQFSDSQFHVRQFDDSTHSRTATDSAPDSGAEAWRDELSQRLALLRTRRQHREPKFPSLQLTLEQLTSEDSIAPQSLATATTLAMAADPQPRPTSPPVPRMYRAMAAVEQEEKQARAEAETQTEAEIEAAEALQPMAHSPTNLPLASQVTEEAQSPVVTEDSPSFAEVPARIPTEDPSESPDYATARFTSEHIANRITDGNTDDNPAHITSDITDDLQAQAGRRVIAFPRIAPYRPSDNELAEPRSQRTSANSGAAPAVGDQLRILDVPEESPSTLPPALGGITLGAMAPARDERIEVPVCPAPLPWRALAEVIDGLFALFATAVFGGVGYLAATQSGRIFGHTLAMPQGKAAIAIAGLTFALVWFAYKYAALVFTRSTPGLRTMGLELRPFHPFNLKTGLPSALDRKRRALRVWASLLSLLPAGLGYLWCLLDEDLLGWHDRITQTYIAVGKQD